MINGSKKSDKSISRKQGEGNQDNNKKTAHSEELVNKQKIEQLKSMMTKLRHK